MLFKGFQIGENALTQNQASMKSIIVLIPAMLLMCRVMAQENRNVQSENQPGSNVVTTIRDAVIMKDGKVWLYKDGQKVLVTNEVNMGGSRIDASGKVTMKDGNVAYMKEGDHIHADGKIEPAESRQREKYPEE